MVGLRYVSVPCKPGGSGRSVACGGMVAVVVIEGVFVLVVPGGHCYACVGVWGA